LNGRHDFRGFAHLPAPRASRQAGLPARDARSKRRNTTRLLSRVALRRLGQEVRLDVEGNGFLHTMVRSIAGTLIDVGRGRLPPGTAARLLRDKDRRLAGATAPAKGLTLVSVTYRSKQ
jgi:tRNA pseudouridine38-40 synthase